MRTQQYLLLIKRKYNKKIMEQKAQDFKAMMNRLFDAFDKLAQADTTSIGANYSMPEMFMSKAIRGDRKSMETLASLFAQHTKMPLQVVQIALEEWINDYKSRQNESRKRTIRLKESELRHMISESVKRILNEEIANHDYIELDSTYVQNDPEYGELYATDLFLNGNEIRVNWNSTNGVQGGVEGNLLDEDVPTIWGILKTIKN